MMAGTIGLAMHACSGPQPLHVAIRPADEEAYLGVLANESQTPREAFLRTKAVASGQSFEQVEAADRAISATENPFRARHDPKAVSQGAVIYKYNCMNCHGANADGRGPEASQPTDAMNFHRFATRFAVTLHGGAPSKWFRIISDGATAAEANESHDKPLTMEPFRDKLAREQIWLVVTYLQSLGG
jgi:mono/diheme cytochrome c family protein